MALPRLSYLRWVCTLIGTTPEDIELHHYLRKLKSLSKAPTICLEIRPLFTSTIEGLRELGYCVEEFDSLQKHWPKRTNTTYIVLETYQQASHKGT